ncbi:uncharacterized protein [Medicago truncatula]|uniref:uncharacterized protein n=1 Tax=Medicago truncatula TaxID=3880 RepID=UPI000D2F21F3|nr:uncharacterized protein LOC112417332 [Medicago truncatula]
MYRVSNFIHNPAAVSSLTTSRRTSLDKQSWIEKAPFHPTRPTAGSSILNMMNITLIPKGGEGVGGVVLNHDGDWITGFSHYEVEGDALLAELRAILICLNFCSRKGYVNIICKSDCFEVVDLIIDGHDHTLHTYATHILHIRDVLHENEKTTLVHVLREQYMCAYFMAKEGSHARCSAHWNCPPLGMESLILRDMLGT